MRNRQARFGREFYSAAWGSYRALKPTIRRGLLVAFLALLLFALSGGDGAVLVVALTIGLCVVALTYRREMDTSWMPSDDELAGADALRREDDADEFEACGSGQVEYEAVLQALLALVGRKVTVLIGTGVGDWRSKAMLSGTLGTARDVADELAYELLMFEVGERGNGFFIDRERFVRGEATARRGDEGLEITTRDGNVLWIAEDAAVQL